MNMEIGAEAALFPEKEYINGIAVAVHTFMYGRMISIGPSTVCIRTYSYIFLTNNNGNGQVKRNPPYRK
jgi:hypothetical protein